MIGFGALAQGAGGFLMANPWRAAALILAVCFALALWGWSDAMDDRELAETKLESANKDVERLTSANQSCGRTLQNLHRENALCVAQWADQKRSGEQAVAEAEHARAEVERRLASFQSRWEQRSKSCGAALMDAERACPELEHY